MKTRSGRSQKKTWSIAPAAENAADFARALKISPILAQLLINRGICDEANAQSFLAPKLMDLIEPSLMPGATGAAKRILQAVENNEKIAIYGDYDVDGITSVSILWHLLTILDARVEYYIPHRIDEGYGLNNEAIKQLAENDVDLIITVDCGINAFAAADLASEMGVELIITDHHQIDKGKVPTAAGIVHPLLDDYANPDSCGAMVAFKLAWAMVKEHLGNRQTPPELRQYLLNATTLAAIGTIADVVDLRGENRILTSFGLKALGESKLTGIVALIQSAELDKQPIDSYHIAFRLAPMLNAAGRMGHARLAVELLTSDSEMRCAQIAEYLKEQNKLRQKCQRDIYKQVREMVTLKGYNHPDRKTIVLANDTWHSGVIGIVASRIVDDYCRPAILINSQEEICPGSARSLPGFNMHQAIGACGELLEGFGGHEMAAGLQIRNEKIDDFAEAFEEYALENLKEELLVSTLEIDALCNIGSFNQNVIKQLGLLDPSGQGNRKPMFATRGVRLIAPPRKVGAKGDHLQISIRDNTGSVRCIGFNMGRLEKKLQEVESFSVAYEPKMNHYNGNSTVQFVLEDIQFE